jgi:two-component system response regulator AlgR
MKTLIVDDEQLARERLGHLVRELPEWEVAGQAASGGDALKFLQETPVDVVLMDIRMPGMDGLEAARHLAAMPNPPAVVFCTAYTDHALEAFDAHAIDYLVKPIRRERLATALSKARKLTPEALSDSGLTESGARTHLCARVRGDLKLVPVENVVYLQAEHKYVTVRHTDGEILIEDSLTTLEEEFGERFLRIHRNALVALAFLSGLEKNDGGHTVVTLKGVDDRLEVSRRNLPAVRQVIKSL